LGNPFRLWPSGDSHGASERSIVGRSRRIGDLIENETFAPGKLGAAGFGRSCAAADLPIYTKAAPPLTGQTAGGGIETHIAGNWSAKLEYLPMDLGSTANTFGYQFNGFPFAFSTTTYLRDDLIRAGLNYEFALGS
jgi:hypothetical protein